MIELQFLYFWCLKSFEKREKDGSVKDGYTKIIFGWSLGYCDLQLLHKTEKVMFNSILLIVHEQSIKVFKQWYVKVHMDLWVSLCGTQCEMSFKLRTPYQLTRTSAQH